MKTSKPVKILIGIFTAFIAIIPFIIAFLYIMILAASFVFSEYSYTGDKFGVIFVLILIAFYAFILAYHPIRLGLRVFYLIHIIKNKTLSDTTRILYGLGIFYLGFITMPIYYIIHVWKDNPQKIQVPEISARSFSD